MSVVLQVFYGHIDSPPEIQKVVVASFGAEAPPVQHLMCLSDEYKGGMSQEDFQYLKRFLEKNKHPLTGSIFDPSDPYSVKSFVDLGDVAFSSQVASVSALYWTPCHLS